MNVEYSSMGIGKEGSLAWNFAVVRQMKLIWFLYPSPSHMVFVFILNSIFTTKYVWPSNASWVMVILWHNHYSGIQATKWCRHFNVLPSRDAEMLGRRDHVVSSRWGDHVRIKRKHRWMMLRGSSMSKKWISCLRLDWIIQIFPLRRWGLWVVGDLHNERL